MSLFHWKREWVSFTESFADSEVEHTYFMMPFELIFHDVKSQEIPSKNFTIVNNKWQDTASSLYSTTKI